MAISEDRSLEERQEKGTGGVLFVESSLTVPPAAAMLAGPEKIATLKNFECLIARPLPPDRAGNSQYVLYPKVSTLRHSPMKSFETARFRRSDVLCVADSYILMSTVGCRRIIRTKWRNYSLVTDNVLF